MVWGETLPSGRERAIETLIDMEPQGSFYRAARVLEESTPQALLHRPNLVTKAALVEQAYALSKNEIDQLSKYDAVFGSRDNACFSNHTAPLVKEQKDRILKHHDKILAAKGGKTTKSSISPSPQLVAALRRVYGEGESSLALRSLLRSVLDHPAFAKEEEATADETLNQTPFQLESLIAGVSRNDGEDSVLLHGLLISVLSLLTNEKDSQKAFSEEAFSEELDPSQFPALQVGSVLSAIKPEEDDKNDWNLDSDLLDYFGRAAAAYEERIEIQKAQLMARLSDDNDGNDDAKEQQQNDPFQTPTTQQQPQGATPSGTNPAVTPNVETPQPASTPDAVAIPEDLQDLSASAAALSAAIFEQIVNAAAGEDTSSNDDDDDDEGGGDSSGSDSDGDNSNFGAGRQRLENDSSSSSSSSSSGGEPGDDDHNNESDDDDMDLRQALALSLVEQSRPLQVDTSLQVAGVQTPSSDPVTPGNATPISLVPTASTEPSESPLPPLPTPPKSYPYSNLLSTMNSDQDETECPYFDPSLLNHFGTLPLPYILVHLLRFSLESIERQKFQVSEGNNNTSSSRSSSYVPKSTVAGGIGATLFPANQVLLKPQKSLNEKPADVGTSLQLLVALFLLISDSRNDAIENLRKAVTQEKKVAQEIDGDESGRKDEDGTSTPEGDDPALAMALHYLDEDTSETKESLEAKGMRRKAAAAAHDAASLLKSLRRRTNGWKHRVKLFSHCTLLSMKCLRFFLQSVVRRWISDSRATSALECHDLLPTNVISKLSMGLASLSSISSYKSLGSLLNESDGSVEDVFMALHLYKDSLLSWGECIPIISPSVTTQVEILKSLLNGCTKADKPALFRSFENMTSFPSSDSELQYHRLQMLCRRLRVGDLLDNFVSVPACYLPDTENEPGVDVLRKTPLTGEPNRASTVIELILSSSSAFGGIKGELQSLYLALCHRYHVRVLLWDGLFACTEPEIDEVAASLTPATGDTVRVGTSPSRSLQFDATKCSDSMAIITNNDGPSSANGSSVHQRASKVWGTVLSSTCFSPKTGVHRWAVKLDKCERGHVFVGVATSQASMRTYVGGDKYGWGMIGTQALWHDRRKIRGDYGATFRTGSTIIVTLDTDAGTLSFTSWKDSTSSSSFSLDPLVQNVASPRRHGHVGGVVEEWGIAFEGLPLDSRLYPAVGLYQRDDRVTLLTVESGGRVGSKENSIDLSGGLCYYPRLTESDGDVAVIAKVDQVRRFNNSLSWDGVQYAIKTLEQIIGSIRECNNEFLWSTLLPSLASALCLVPPSIPILSERNALALLPELTKCVQELERCRGDRSMVHRLFRTGLREGKWVIRATGSSGSVSDAEEYVVDFSASTNENGSIIGFEGSGVGTTGKSKNGLVAIFGTVKGSSIHFVEEWTDGNEEGFNSVTSDDAASSCVVNARLSLDGTKFEGTYRNVQFGTTGQIAGLLSTEGNKLSKFRLEDAPASSKQSAELASASVSGEALLCLAHSQTATIISEDAGEDHSYGLEKPEASPLSPVEWKARRTDLKQCLSLPLFSRLSAGGSSESLSHYIEELRSMYAPPSEAINEALPLLDDSTLRNFLSSDESAFEGTSISAELENLVAQVDGKLCAVSGGTGSLSVLCPSEYREARSKLICVFLVHCRLTELLNKEVSENIISGELKEVWISALRIMEDGVRKSISTKTGSASRGRATETCTLYGKISTFFLELEAPVSDALGCQAAMQDLARIFSVVTCEADLVFLSREMSRSSKRALLRLIPIHEMVNLLDDSNGANRGIESPVAIESLAIAIPKLLGRKFSAPSSGKKSQRVGGKQSLGSHYLSGLPGVSSTLSRGLQKKTHLLLQAVCRISEHAISRRNENNSSEFLVSIDSMVLAVLASFACVLGSKDLEFLLLRTELPSILPDLLNQHRFSILGPSVAANSEKKISVVKDLHEICHREISRSLLRVAVAAVHVIAYQTLGLSNKVETDDSSLSRCLDVILGEVLEVIPLVQGAIKDTVIEYRQDQATLQWEDWSGAAVKGKNQKTPRKESTSLHQVGRSGIKFLNQHGIAQATGVPPSAQKSSSRSRGSQQASSSRGEESTVRFQGNFCHQFLSHWIHVLVGLTKVEKSREMIAHNVKWVKTIFEAIGLRLNFGELTEVSSVELMDAENLLPGRYRCRLLRLLYPILIKSGPSEAIIDGLFSLAGSSSNLVSKHLEEDEKSISRELVSLLRQLHSPGIKTWRSQINSRISNILESRETKDSMKRIGVLCFFNGTIDMISRGSYVLLKPAAAAPFSMEQQSASGSKGHGSSTGGGPSGTSSMPHHVVGNGTEGVVAGLCRADAAAGIVSSIDLKNRVCEVILLSRDGEKPEETSSGESSFRGNLDFTGSKGSHTSRHTLTVRALRSPLTDVVQAQEIPLFLDESIPVGGLVGTLLEQSLSFLESRILGLNALEETKSNEADEISSRFESMRSDMIRVSEAVMTVRSAITLLSDKKMLVPFLRQAKSQKTLSSILRLGFPDESIEYLHKKFLSSLPAHEARWVHVMSLYRTLNFRVNILNETSKDVWQDRLEELKTRKKAVALELAGASGGSGAKDGSITPPPPDSGSAPGTPPVSSAIAGSSERTASRESESANREVSRSTAGSDNSEGDDDSESAATAAAHLREAAIAQMAELGLPRSWSELALRRTGGTNIEAAVHFCLERGGEMERLLAEERERVQRQSSGGSSSRRRSNRAEQSNHLLRQLLEMGFPSRWCAEALAATGNNVDEALTWILTNGERLSAEDEGMEDGEEDDDIDDEDESQDDEESADGQTNGETSEVGDADNAASKKEATEENACLGWTGSMIPLRFISGRSIINPKTLTISGLPTGGFSSVGTKGVMLTQGKWYYEAILETAGCLQIGWADGSFSGHCHADRGDGCGDGPSSWAYDGWRRYRWHATATEWGCRWKEGDVIGCMVDMDNHVVSFTLNGRAEEIGMGVAFSGEGFRPCGGVYACVSFNRKEKLKLILGGSGSEPFKYAPPAGYFGVGEAVLNAVEEREALIAKESILDHRLSLVENDEEEDDIKKRFLCDFSDGEHGHELMAWAHRYYGSDASVHLGSGRMKQSGALPKSSSSSSSDVTASVCLKRRIEQAWKKKLITEEKLVERDLEEIAVLEAMSDGYVEVGTQLCKQTSSECIIMSSLLARKLLLHVIIAMGENFDPDCCLASDDSKSMSALRFWKMLESSANLRSAGWVGEAGAMAIAAEALGLGISSNDTSHSRHSSTDRSGIASISDLDDGMLLPSGGIVQLLSTVLDWDYDSGAYPTSSTLTASAEAALGSDGGGGVLIHLQKGLQGAMSRSKEVRKVILASIRRSVRRLAVVEYDSEDTSTTMENEEGDDVESSSALAEKNSGPKEGESDEKFSQPDARLISFLTGLFLTPQVQEAVDDFEEIQIELFEAWSIGMLSASIPWRMVCAFTAAGILNSCQQALVRVTSSLPTLCRFYGRLESTVSRRIWAERAAAPVCSRYAQAMLELLCSVKRSVDLFDLPSEFLKYWNTPAGDAATPLPLPTIASSTQSFVPGWEAEDNWISSDSGWEIWTGTVDFLPVDWKTPTRSAVRTLMDGGDGPPMLREGCTVMRGLDWENGNFGNEDGKAEYEAEKAKREEEKQKAENAKEVEPAAPSPDTQSGDGTGEEPTDDGHDPASSSNVSVDSGDAKTKKKKKKKPPNPKLPLGTVVSIEPWNGIPGMARRVRWHLTEKEGVYRYGGDGGRYDISHVEANEKATRVRKRHPLPESAEQCASRHGFGAEKTCCVLLRLRQDHEQKVADGEMELNREGILEWPDFGAAILVDCTLHQDRAVTIKEKQLLYGSKDSGWEARFGQPSFISGTTLVLYPTKSSSSKDQESVDVKSAFSSLYEELLGSTSLVVETLRNREDGSKLCLKSEMRLFRGRGYKEKAPSMSAMIQAPLPPPINFDREYHASSLSLSQDGRTVSCISSEGRGTAFASVGFTKGVHYWEVKLEQADIGSVFIGVAEKPTGSGSGSSYGYDSPPRLNRWHGWGFVNFRATYTAGAERIYGAHCHAGDTVGVLLDCDAGRISFFFDGLKYGEHILNDLGCAFENISPFGFNVDGCGSGGAAQGAPSGVEGGRSGRYPAQGAVRPRALWPVIGLRNHGDRVTISPKWMSSYGIDGFCTVRNAIAVDEILHCYSSQSDTPEGKIHTEKMPAWFIREAFSEYRKWDANTWCRTVTRGSGPYRSANFGLDLDLDSSPLACAAASALLGLKCPLLAGDRVRLKRSAGRILELAEEAVVLGTYQGRLFYRMVSQKSEGGSLTEGGGRAWCWDESEVVDGLPAVNTLKCLGIELPLMNRFRCTSPGGLRIVYEGGAVVRSDLEIFDGSMNLGSIPLNTVIPQNDVFERRVNSCGVVRFRVRFESLVGWISSKIRGGKEEAIVAPVDSAAEGQPESKSYSYATARDCAEEWYQKYQEKVKPPQVPGFSSIADIDSFVSLAAKGIITGLSVAESDTFLVKAVGAISDFCDSGNALEAPLAQVASAVSFAIASVNGTPIPADIRGSNDANQAAATQFASLNKPLPPVDAILARVAMLRLLNRRAKLALPWLSLRPCQEGAAILGGIQGHGASIERAGRYWNAKSRPQQWPEVPSVATKLRSLRGLLFTSVKRDLLLSITEATTTPTPLSHDEYELPREIRTVRLNRLKARRLIAGADSSAKRKHSVFAQLHNETKSWGGAALRRGFVAKGHGGQKRAFKIKLIGEGVNDYSGPYREAFTDALAEILDVDKQGRGTLGVLDATPNNASQIGENRDLFMFSLNGGDFSSHLDKKPALSPEESRILESFASLTLSRDERSREVEEALVFLGRLTGTALRHGIPLDLPLPLESVWKAIAEESTTELRSIDELDTLASQQLKNVSGRTPLLYWQQRMLNSFVDGLSNVLPVEILTIFSGEELRDIICGNPEVDVDLLRRVVEYEGYEESDPVIQFFWETLREFTNDERKSFLQFVWARNRLPMKESDFDAPFKIQKDSSNKNGDQALPSASTCFFSLSLPEYSRKKQLKEKLLFAINNVTTMETDFQTNSAEIAEGYRL